MRNSKGMPKERVAGYIHVVRGQKVVLDSDLALLYGVETRRLNEQVRRNADRFPPDFAFYLTTQEVTDLMSQIATSSRGHGGRRKATLAFTEHGALMAATVLNSGRAIEISLYLVRAFVELRRIAAQNADLARKLDELERKTSDLAANHADFSAETRKLLAEAFDAIRHLMAPPERSQARPIGFIAPTPKKS